MKSDRLWINTWKDQLSGRSVLELGCGEGIDTVRICEHAKSVVASDINPRVIAGSNLSVRALDHSKPLPFEEDEFDVVVGSLCLHYFHWKKTVEVVGEISRILGSKGTFLGRFNSIDDTNYGAVGYTPIEEGFYDVKGTFKRFFEEGDIRALFGNGWKITFLEHKIIDRYSYPKAVWEICALNTKQINSDTAKRVY